MLETHSLLIGQTHGNLCTRRQTCPQVHASRSGLTRTGVRSRSAGPRLGDRTNGSVLERVNTAVVASAGTFMEAYILAITQAIRDYCRGRCIDGPLYMVKDIHGPSALAERTALFVPAANDV